jgi:DNA-binding MarR family transcriptional regulator
MQMRLEGALARQLAADSGISYPDYVVLVALLLGWETSRLSHQVSRMAARGLVRRERCAHDRRGSEIVLTAEGRRTITAAAPGHVAAVRRWFVDVLEPAELEALRVAAEKVLARLDAAPA